MYKYMYPTSKDTMIVRSHSGSFTPGAASLQPFTVQLHAGRCCRPLPGGRTEHQGVAGVERVGAVPSRSEGIRRHDRSR